MRTNAINYLLSFEIAVKNLELVTRESAVSKTENCKKNALFVSVSAEKIEPVSVRGY